jgi:GNAT superfamily N-acetyltransferase
MFDLALQERCSERFQAEVPDRSEPWDIGLIVGPSGSGKSTVAREAFGEDLYRPGSWPEDRAVIDALGDLPLKSITSMLTAVGFGSPPSWIKPFGVLSNGEQHRCEMVRAFAEKIQEASTSTERPLVVFDEFTSVVGRNVAAVSSAAIARGVRKGWIPCRFVGVTCHEDVAAWLEPDWILDMASGRLQRRRLRRSTVHVGVHRCKRDLWKTFARYHYLSGVLSPTARCYVALWEGVQVAFCATLSLIGRKGRWRISRLVTLPDYQGLGIGMRLAEAVAEYHVEQGHRMNVTSSHPAMISHCRRSPRWRAVNVMKRGSRGDRFVRGYRGSAGRAVVSFEFVRPERLERE